MPPIPDKNGMPVLDITTLNDFEEAELPSFSKKVVSSEN
jgi:hypothetical protein